jgi:glycerol-3-phosphate dehydrogenase subunit C
VKVELPEKPTAAWDYRDDDYWDAAKLERELRRVADICHQCRRCLPLCPSFPTLFELIDATDREVAGVANTGFDRVNELCFHCKLCYNHCPYTPPHEWDVDFPALMRRHQLQRTKRDGVSLARKLTTKTDLIGKLGAAAPALMNFANTNRASRVLMEKTVGIHRDWVQPTYSAETLSRWYEKRGGARVAGANGRAVLFATCSVNYSDAEVGRAAVEVLERSDVRVDLHAERCCGMPYTDVGDLDALRRHAERNVADLLPQVEAGALVIVPGPSCSLLFKHEYPKLLGTEAAAKVAAATRDLMEFVFQLGKDKKWNRDFQVSLGKVAYHAPCHLRHQNVGFPARAVLKAAGAEVELVDACSGVDGTWGMQARFHEASLGVAKKMVERITASEPDHIATDCPLSALRIEEALGRKALHPIVLVRRAYGGA